MNISLATIDRHRLETNRLSAGGKTKVNIFSILDCFTAA
jgi:hypothetical protein